MKATTTVLCACALHQCSGFIAPCSRNAVQNHRTVAASSSGTTEEKLTSWRDKVDLLLNPRLSLSERQVLSKDLLNDLPKIRDDVQAAASKGGARAVLEDVILSPGSEARRAAAGIRAVQRQVREDILPELQKELRNASSQGSESNARIKSLLNDELPKQVEQALRDLPEKLKQQDLSPQGVRKAADMIREEVLNSVSRTPSGLYTPPYDVLETGPADEARSLPQYEIRRYGKVSLVSASMSSSSSAGSGDAFNTLAGYLFGGNAQQQSMQMTTPVTIDVGAASEAYERMSFVLPEGVSASEAPSPVDGKVILREVSDQLVAVREFTGFATPNEVRREVQLLRDALSGSQWQEAEGAAVQLFQYNPPYAVPWVRRNEVALRLQDAESSESSSSSSSSSAISTAADSAVADTTVNGAGSSTASASASASSTPDYSPAAAAGTAGAGAAAANPASSYLDALKGASSGAVDYSPTQSTKSGESPANPASSYLDDL